MNFDGALVGSSLVMFMQNWPATMTSVTYPASGATTQYVSDLTPNTTYDITGAGTPGTATTDTAGVLVFSASGTGNITVAASGVSVDTTPPVTSITSPANNANVSSTIQVSATASDNVGVTSVSLYADGSLVATDNTAPYTFSLNTASLTNGSHTLFAKAYDAAGNIGTSANVTVTVSNTVSTPAPQPSSGGGSGGGGSITPTTFSITSANVTDITTSTAMITITTSLPGITLVEYGKTSSYGQSSDASRSVTTNVVTLQGLAPGTLYHYVVTGNPAGGKAITSAPYTFTTLGTSAGGGVTTPSSGSSSPAAPSSPSSVFTKPLSIGASGTPVVTLQNILHVQGFLQASVPATGYFGSLTSHALLLFQSAHDLSTTGSVDPETEALLNKIVAAGGASPSAPSSTPSTPTAVIPTTPVSSDTLTKNLAPGSTGTQVTVLQHILNADGDYPAAIYTSYYGSLTEAAVKRFQTEQGIVSYGTPDTTGYGAVGPRTRAKLDGE
jgi:peptidoglycan hydrolase-like protein with peptidoglycan-binding domain